MGKYIKVKDNGLLIFIIKIKANQKLALLGG